MSCTFFSHKFLEPVGAGKTNIQIKFNNYCTYTSEVVPYKERKGQEKETDISNFI